MPRACEPETQDEPFWEEGVFRAHGVHSELKRMQDGTGLRHIVSRDGWVYTIGDPLWDQEESFPDRMIGASLKHFVAVHSPVRIDLSPIV